MSKIYEASTLLAAMEQRLTEYTALEKQLLAVKTEFEVIVQMEDELQGEGAKAIKNFFQAQAKVVDAWVDFISMQTSFLSAISGDMEEADLSGNTFIQESFLEQECLNGLTNSIMMTMAQREALQEIFNGIDDILPLEMYDAEPYYEKMGDAGKERTATEAALNKLDEQWKQEYQHSEASQSNVFGLLGELMKASSQGGTVSPMSFDKQAFHDSEIYQLQGEMKKYSSDYVQYKEDQETAREQVKKAKEMEARPWYEKMWDTASTFTGEITGYYDYKRASEGIDPVTGQKLSDAQRIAAGAMAAAGFIPVVGWAGRAAKGGSAIYKTTKGVNAAAHTLDAYKSAKSFDVLQKTEMGIYGLVAANGLSEYINGQDMFGNELTEEQRQNSLYTALGIAGVAGAAKYVDHLQVKNAPFKISQANTRTITRNKADFEKLVSYVNNENGYVKLPGKIGKGTGDVHRSEIDEVIKKDYDINGNVVNRSVVPKGYDSIDDFLKAVDDTTIKEFGYDSVEEFKMVVGHVDDYLNESPKNNILNKRLAGGKHVKGVEYDVIGFPIFKGDDVKFSLKLEKEYYIMKDTDQFLKCTEKIRESINKGEVTKELFTKKQLAQIEDGLPRIDGLVWHHHQVPGKMQLVLKKVHSVNHLGGNSLWGGGIR